ncbi:hypothetical protein HanRHA438_Chr00c22g0853381 [Helianthus annuus]|uniref:Uncharacterized protein n=1 Tax=Helianthus annuus TaxID=4232 RepID=A0A251VJ47_HELAN|nr:hypothetical protein HanXRQr2_Chr02g0086121 [Helianthus annuus]KAJ0606253.1 hypothetical protein HanHA300_Chr02g0071961 [Helianthus annuus]KAJ0617257.1 hypothetical protein HanIR_Chr02g0099411 [Helianthus annuus]KAJ0620272.1 hypothetical protein HanHA89_Chr02g0080431 [Helianthus annuus]KAJ0778726.1 hypothetical protein HanLR1_Chr02g0074781 [Helianthus annuus]
MAVQGGYGSFPPSGFAPKFSAHYLHDSTLVVLYGFSSRWLGPSFPAHDLLNSLLQSW